MSFVEQDRAQTTARRRRFYGDETNYCRRLDSYSGVAVGKMWLGLDPETDYGTTRRRAVDIVNAVLKVTMIPRNDFYSARRFRKAAEARQIACFLLRGHTRLSLPQIGALIGGKNHSTVMHAVHAVNQNIGGKFTRRVSDISMELGLLPSREMQWHPAEVPFQ